MFAQDHFLYFFYDGSIWSWAKSQHFFVVLWTEGYISQVLPTWILSLLYGPILRQLNFAMPKQSSSFYMRLGGHMILNCRCAKTLWWKINSFLSKPIKYKNYILHSNMKFLIFFPNSGLMTFWISSVFESKCGIFVLHCFYKIVQWSGVAK